MSNKPIKQNHKLRSQQHEQGMPTIHENTILSYTNQFKIFTAKDRTIYSLVVNKSYISTFRGNMWRIVMDTLISRLTLLSSKCNGTRNWTISPTFPSLHSNPEMEERKVGITMQNEFVKTRLCLNGIFLWRSLSR